MLQELVDKLRVFPARLRQKRVIGVDAIDVKLLTTGAQTHVLLFCTTIKMLHQDVFEHIARDGVDIIQGVIFAHNINHTCLNLVPFTTFVVQAMHVECHTCGNRE